MTWKQETHHPVQMLKLPINYEERLITCLKKCVLIYKLLQLVRAWKWKWQFVPLRDSNPCYSFIYMKLRVASRLAAHFQSSKEVHRENTPETHDILETFSVWAMSLSVKHYWLTSWIWQHSNFFKVTSSWVLQLWHQFSTLFRLWPGL